jgi:hypothetical protein
MVDGEWRGLGVVWYWHAKGIRTRSWPFLEVLQNVVNLGVKGTFGSCSLARESICSSV